MKVRVDRNNDVLYFRLDESRIIESEEVQPGVILDYNENNQVVGMKRRGRDRITSRATLGEEFPTRGTIYWIL